MSENNPLLQTYDLPPFSAIRPEHVQPAIEQILADNRAGIQKILLTPEAMGWGLGGAMLLSFGLECLFRLIDWVVLGGKRLRQSRPIEERDLKGL